MKSSQQPLISFIITVYQLPTKYVHDCLNSIIQLSLGDNEREVILIDDGSNPAIISLLPEWQDSIIYLRQRNHGVSSARNLGMNLATGKYIQFVDGDDYLLSSAYEHCIDIVRFQQADIVTFNMTNKSSAKSAFHTVGPLLGNEYMRHNNVRGTACGYLFERRLLLDLQFSSHLSYGEDEEFTPQLLLRAEHLYSTDAPAYYYRQHANSTLHHTDQRHQVQRLDNNLQVIIHLKHLALTLPIADREAMLRRVAQLSMDYLYNTIRIAPSMRHLDKAIHQLRQYELFPLPDKEYTWKYQCFCQMVNSHIGRRLLLLTLSHL